MIKRLKTINPDVIHIHNLHSNYMNLRLLFNYVSKNNIGLVLTLHDCWYFTGKCVHPIFANCNRFQHTCKDCPQLKSDRINPTLFLILLLNVKQINTIGFTKYLMINYM